MSDNSDQDQAGAKQQSGKFLRLRPSYWWAIVITVLIGGWLLSGEIIIGGKADGRAVTANPSKSPSELVTGSIKSQRSGLFTVRTRPFTATLREAVLVIRGRTETDAKVDIKAETPGMVEDLPVRKGDWVKKGTLLCRIEEGARRSQVIEATALLAQAKADYEAQTSLASQGHTAQLKVAEYLAKLDTAKARLKSAELDLERTRLDAPFAGIIEAQPAKIGDFLAVGGTCATLVSIDPLLVVGAISERDVRKVRTGMPASAELVTGERVDGKIRFISASANPETRTFRVELEIANKAGEIRDGITADIYIAVHTPHAHLLPPAILTLNDAGEIGVRTIQSGDTVRFKKVTILSDGKDGVWVAGLPEKVQIITVGQDYVVDGQKVKVSEELAAN